MNLPPRPAMWVWGCRLFLGGAFVFAGAIKLLDPAAFATSVAGFRLLPREWSNVVAIGLPPLEVLCGACVLCGLWLRPAALALALLNALFIGALAQGMARGLSFECGCFGRWDPLAHQPALAIVRDVLFVAAAAVLFRHALPENPAARSL